jgi:exodeoxyribonuclease VII large subunit
VQGPGAARGIAGAIARLDASGVDVICVVRGGGSLEDLWCFNELEVAEAVWAASVPVVSGVGHQSDVTLCDLVADHRAHTPTDAAQTVLPERARLQHELERRAAWLAEALDRQLARRAERLAALERRRVLRDASGVLAPRVERVGGAARRLRLALARRLDGARGELARCAERLAGQSPAVRLERLESRLAPLTPRLAAAARRALAAREQRLSVSAKGIDSTSPFAVLARGYSITRTAGGRAVRVAADLRPGDALETLFDAGRARSTVDEVEPGEGGA